MKSDTKNFLNAPSYLKLFKTGKLNAMYHALIAKTASCNLCPRNCKVNRAKNLKGYCQTGSKARVFSVIPHHGEEPPISGQRGSGTIFFSHCTMKCVYCQNFSFSQAGEGRIIDNSRLANHMLYLQKKGCHNINFVTPTHVLPQIIGALLIAVPAGLTIPLIYNTSGYDSVLTLRLIEGIFDIFLADMRYSDEAVARKYSDAIAYPQTNQAAILEMFKQVGNVQINRYGIIKKGLIIRHLVLPNNISGTEEIMRFIAQKVSVKAFISLMSQYKPYYHAPVTPEINRKITTNEYLNAQKSMEKYRLYTGWIQEESGEEELAGIHLKQNL